MYYEEQIINGVLYWRGDPGGKWIKFSKEQLTTKLLETRQEVNKAKEKISELEGAIETYREIMQK